MAHSTKVDELGIEMDDKLRATTIHVEKADSSKSGSDANVAPQQTMTKAVWLACIALCLAYTTAFQQSSCTNAIVKHIDTELGMFSLG
jgi:hypothetical protein